MPADESRTIIHLLERTRMVIRRLERLPADSPWAHRASGCRGALLRWAVRLEAQADLEPDEVQVPAEDLKSLLAVLNQSFAILSAAAQDRLR